MSIASVTSVAATLLILGVIFILIINITGLTQIAKDQFDTVQVYLDDDIETQQIEEIGTNIMKLEGVKDAIFETKEDALNKMKMDWADNAYLLEGLESNPLPNSYMIILDDIAFSDYVVNTVKEYDGVEEVKYYKEIIEKIMAITLMIRKVGLTIMIILIAISTFIISNTIKIAVNTRRREINIMKYVGATNWFIRWPFLLEGIVLGFLGAIISAVLLYFSYDYAINLIMNDFYSFVSAYIIGAKEIISDLVIIFLIIGIGIGSLGSIASLRKHLNV